ncbi:hypothetical protein MKW94_026156 [Papaver nudicaule]|uniref:Uncharacterized protein n=1 Tax=Papaver nudicaule TaxID=74823 RepID=A0AA41V1Z0_PAPNU|nr:hypothetical protein [Papaver nudicaule]
MNWIESKTLCFKDNSLWAIFFFFFHGAYTHVNNLVSLPVAGLIMEKIEEDRLEELLMVSSILLSLCSAVALKFIQAIAIVESKWRDPFLDHSLVTLYRVFAASFISSVLGFFVNIAIALTVGRYHPRKKFCLTISTAASVVFIVLGYVLLILFNNERL